MEVSGEHAEGFMSGVVTICVAIIGVASLAVVLSRRSNTANIIQNAAVGISDALQSAEAPVTGAAEAPNLNYVGSGALGTISDEWGY